MLTRLAAAGVAAVTLAALTATGVTWAQERSGDATVSACYAKRSGDLRIVKAGASCRKGERSLSWGRTGPQGVPGPAGSPGAAGPVGPVGPVGPSKAYRLVTDTTAVAVTTAGAQLGSLTLPAGSYVIDFGVRVSGGSGGATNAECYLTRANEAISRSLNVNLANSPDRKVLAATTTTTFTSTGEVTLRCAVTLGPQFLADTVTMTATAVGSIEVQQD